MAAMPRPHHDSNNGLRMAVEGCDGAKHLCRHFLKGRCTWGDSCRFSHQSQTPIATPAADVAPVVVRVGPLMPHGTSYDQGGVENERSEHTTQQSCGRKSPGGRFAHNPYASVEEPVPFALPSHNTARAAGTGDHTVVDGVSRAAPSGLVQPKSVPKSNIITRPEPNSPMTPSRFARNPYAPSSFTMTSTPSPSSAHTSPGVFHRPSAVEPNLGDFFLGRQLSGSYF